MRKLSRKESEMLEMLDNKYISEYVWYTYYAHKMESLTHDENGVYKKCDENTLRNLTIECAQYNALQKVHKQLIKDTLKIWGISEIESKRHISKLITKIFDIVEIMDKENWPWDKMDNFPMWSD